MTKLYKLLAIAAVGLSLAGCAPDFDAGKRASALVQRDPANKCRIYVTDILEPGISARTLPPFTATIEGCVP